MQIIHPSANIHPTAIIGENVVIEANVYIGPYCIVGAPPEHKRHRGEDAGVIICEGSTLTGLVTVDAGTKTPTTIGENCYLMKHSHVGHDAELKDDVTLACGAKIGGHAIIHNRANIGLNATIHQFKEIPEGVMIGMGSVVTKNQTLTEWRKYAGVPVKDIGSNLAHK